MKTFFLEFAERSPLIIDGAMLYLLSPHIVSEDYLQFPNSAVRLGLTPAGTSSELERIFEILRKKEIEKVKKDFVEKKINQGFIEERDRQKYLGERKIISFIVKDLMPFMNGHKENVLDVLGEVQEQATAQRAEQVDEKELLATLEKTKADLKREIEIYGERNFGRPDNIDFYLSQLIAHKRILALEGTIYNLVASKNEESQLDVYINGVQTSNLMIKSNLRVGHIEEGLSNFLQWKAQIKSVDEYSDYMREIYRTKLVNRGNLEEIMKMKEFKEGDIGFVRRNNGIYVYQSISPFAMLDPRPTKQDVCYEFPACRVGINIYDYAGQISLDKPLLFESLWHPFVQNKVGEFQHLCGGNIPPRQTSEVEWVAKALDDAKNLVMNGLTPESIKIHNGNATDGGHYFGEALDTKLAPRIISIEQAKQKGLLLTNKWDWNKENDNHGRRY